MSYPEYTWLKTGNVLSRMYLAQNSFVLARIYLQTDNTLSRINRQGHSQNLPLSKQTRFYPEHTWLKIDNVLSRMKPGSYILRELFEIDNLSLLCRPEATQLINFSIQLASRQHILGERGGSVVECRTPEREVRGSRPTSAVLCPWARHFTPRKYWLITQEAMAPSRHDWKIVDWDVKPQHNQQQHILV